jgi:hypothetical protein
LVFKIEKSIKTNDIVRENEGINKLIVRNCSPVYTKDKMLPNIPRSVLGQPKIWHKRTSIGNSKYMGSRFNPNNYDYSGVRNMTKRNVFGALFQH